MGVFFIISNSKGSTVEFVWQNPLNHIPKMPFRSFSKFRVHRVLRIPENPI